MFVAGIDAHATYSVTCVVSKEGQLVSGADSERSGPGIPRHVGHPFRSKWATDSEGSGPPIPRKRSCHSDMWATLGA